MHTSYISPNQGKRPPKPVVTNYALTFAPSPDSSNTRKRTCTHTKYEQMNTWRDFPPSFTDLLPSPPPSHADLLTEKQCEQYWNDIHQLRQQYPHLSFVVLHNQLPTSHQSHPQPTPHPPPRCQRNEPPSIVLQRNASKLSHTKSSHRNVNEKHFRKQKRFYTKCKCQCKYKPKSIQLHSHQRRIRCTIHSCVHQHTQQCIQHTTDIQKPRQHNITSALSFTQIHTSHNTNTSSINHTIRQINSPPHHHDCPPTWVYKLQIYTRHCTRPQTKQSPIRRHRTP